MKASKLVPALILILPLATAPCVCAGDDKPTDTPLPMSCTLLAMPPTERAAHLERLKLLKQAATGITVTPEGFTFKVNLQTMPLKELQTWAQAEQNCCSFLKIDSQLVEAEKLTVVHVVCSADERQEMMQTFGLKPES